MRSKISQARPGLSAAVAAILFLGFAPLLPAAQETDVPAPLSASAQACMNELRVFDRQMQADGNNWPDGSGYGYGSPVGASGDGGRSVAGKAQGAKGTHVWARPGYEIRTLTAAAGILAERGRPQECEAMLTIAREAYKDYAQQLRQAQAPKADVAAWRRRQVAAATPVARSKAAFRADRLIGTDIVNGQGDHLGDVFDVVTNAQTGKIGYLVVGRGGLLGIGERHIPVPWEAFRMTAAGSILVLGVSGDHLDKAPSVSESHFFPHGGVGLQGANADAFWRARILK